MQSLNLRNLFVSALAALCAASAQASPVTEPGLYLDYSYRYEFDVSSSDIYWLDGSITNVTTGKDVTDPALAKTVGDLIHPLRDGLDKTGRVIIELSKMTELVDDGGYLDDREWMQINCSSGFICDAGWLYSTYNYHFPTAAAAASGFFLYGGELDWEFRLTGDETGTLRFDGDDEAEGESVTIDGVTYGAIQDSQALFTLANVQVTRLDAPVSDPPLNTPLPAPVLMLLTALGGGAWLARRRRGA
jgi:hypothetical protein